MAPTATCGLHGLTRPPGSPLGALRQALPQSEIVAVADAARREHRAGPSVFIAIVERHLDRLLPLAPAPGPCA